MSKVTTPPPATGRKMVEIMETQIKDGTVVYYKGETCSLPTEQADKWISLGWVKCVETGQLCERVPGAVRLDAIPNRVVAKAAAE
jgi:hypothetical protein